MHECIVKSLLARLNVAQKLVEKGTIDEQKASCKKRPFTSFKIYLNVHLTVEIAETLVKSRNAYSIIYSKMRRM